MDDNKTLASVRKPVKVLDGPVMYGIFAAVVVVLLIFGFTGAISSNAMRYLLKVFLYITMAEMWNLLSGFTGMTSLGQQLYIGISGFAVAVLTTTYSQSLVVGVIVGAIICLVVSFGLSFVLFRMRGMYFAIATWVVAETVCLWFKSWRFVNMGGGMSITAKPYPSTANIYIVSLIICVVAVLAVYFLLRTKTGLGLTAMRDDADAASSVGVNIFKSKLMVYIIAAVFTAIGGAVFFINKGTIYPDGGFDIGWTVSLVFIVIIGGVGTMSGPILGAVIYVILDEYLAHFPGWSNIILGLVAILVILFLPDGVMGTLQKKLNFEVFSQKRFSEPSAKKQLGKKAKAE